jgi:sugar phosphate isomerase/epimerase
VCNTRDVQLLLGPHGPHTDPVLTGPPDAKRAHALRAALTTIEIAADLGVGQARLMFGVPDLTRWLTWSGTGLGWEDNVAAWRSAVAPVLDAAARRGVTVLLEPLHKQVVYDRPSAEQVLASVAGHPCEVRLCVDPANLAAMGHDPVAMVRGWGPALGAVHAKDLQKDGTAPGGDGWSRWGPGPAVRFRALGHGELPWPGIVSALREEGYTGVVYVEQEDEVLPRDEAVRTSLGVLGDLLGRGAGGPVG